jgi:hypothetical protein
MNDLLKKLNIDKDNLLTKTFLSEKQYDHVKDMIPHKKHYNYMSDLLFLPEDKLGYKYLLVVVDLATDQFDIEPIKNKSAETVLTAFIKMFKRPYIKIPYASIRTDAGSEFKGVFHKWLYDKNIFHRIALAGRHKQLANVERLNRQLARLINGYLSSKEQISNKIERDWVDVLPIIRKSLNKIRKKPEGNIFLDRYPIPTYIEPKFNKGQMVHYKLDEPENALGHKQTDKRFREMDNRASKFPLKIVNVFAYPFNNRYMLEGMPNVSFTENELRLSKDQQNNKYEVKEIIGRKKIKNKNYVLIWWHGYKKADATWEPASSLLP